ncbi:MAG: hypothetical protein IJD97_10375 [Clostridia bacterium]|nr:hypothetical protein [Clostridia bacterium]
MKNKTLREIIELADELNPNSYSANVKTQWIDEVESYIYTEIFNVAPDDVPSFYPYNEVNAEKTLTLDSTNDKIYLTYLQAMIDFSNKEYAAFNNDVALYNTYLDTYAKWYQRTHGDGAPLISGMYLSAYGIAVKHGFKGTEEEWIVSLKGEKGDTGHGLEIKGVAESFGELPGSANTGDVWLIPMDAMGEPNDWGISESYRTAELYIWNGTEWQSIGSFKGEQGPQGLPGAKGEKGDKGDKGDAGEDASKNIIDGEKANSVRTVKANPIIGEGGVAFGEGATAGCMGYYWDAIDITNKIIYLSSSLTNTSPQIVTNRTPDTSFVIPTVDGNTYAVGDRFYIMNGTTHITTACIKAINGDAITYDSDIEIKSIKSGTHSFCVPSKYQIGIVNLFKDMIALGFEVIAAADNTFSAGCGSIAGAANGAAFGRDTFAGYAALASGIRTMALWDGGFSSGIDTLASGRYAAVFNRLCQALAEAAFACGQNTKSKKKAGFSSGIDTICDGVAGLVGGRGSKVLADYAIALGWALQATNVAQAVFGKYNIPIDDALLILGNGTHANKLSNAMVIHENGDAEFGGTVTDGSGNVLGAEVDLMPFVVDGTEYYCPWGMTWEHLKYYKDGEIWNKLGLGIDENGLILKDGRAMEEAVVILPEGYTTVDGNIRYTDGISHKNCGTYE